MAALIFSSLHRCSSQLSLALYTDLYHSAIAKWSRLHSYALCASIALTLPSTISFSVPAGCSSSALWRLARRRRHVAKTSNGRQVIIRISARNSKRRVGLPPSMRKTPSEVPHHSSRSGTGQSPLSPLLLGRLWWTKKATYARSGSAPKSMNPPTASSRPPRQRISKHSCNGSWIATRRYEPATASTITGGF